MAWRGRVGGRGEARAGVPVEGRRARVDAKRLAQVVLREVVLFLAVVDVAEAVPRIVVPLVDADRRAVARHRLLKVVVRRVLVARERVGVGKVGLQLDGALEELEGGIVLLLEREAVAHHAARVRARALKVERALREVAQGHLALEMPQDGRVHLHAAQAVRLDGLGLLEGTKGLGVLDHLKVGAPHLIQHPARVVLPGRQRAEGEHGVLALVQAQGAVPRRALSQQPQSRVCAVSTGRAAGGRTRTGGRRRRHIARIGHAAGPR